MPHSRARRGSPQSLAPPSPRPPRPGPAPPRSASLRSRPAEQSCSLGRRAGFNKVEKGRRRGAEPERPTAAPRAGRERSGRRDAGWGFKGAITPGGRLGKPERRGGEAGRGAGAPREAGEAGRPPPGLPALPAEARAGGARRGAR